MLLIRLFVVIVVVVMLLSLLLFLHNLFNNLLVHLHKEMTGIIYNQNGGEEVPMIPAPIKTPDFHIEVVPLKSMSSTF